MADNNPQQPAAVPTASVIPATGQASPNPYHRYSLLGMPNELKTIILKMVESPKDLGNLIASSKQYYQVFISQRVRILGDVLQNAFLPDVLHHAIAVGEVSMRLVQQKETGLPDQLWGPGDEDLTKFLDKYFEGKLALPLDWESLKYFCRLERQISWYAKALAESCLKSFRNSSGSLPISRSERTRLHRALLRFELYTKVCVLDNRTSPAQFMSSNDQAALFLSRMEQWEVEEITCVYQYVSQDIYSHYKGMNNRFYCELLQNKDAFSCCRVEPPVGFNQTPVFPPSSHDCWSLGNGNHTCTPEGESDDEEEEEEEQGNNSPHYLWPPPLYSPEPWDEGGSYMLVDSDSDEDICEEATHEDSCEEATHEDSYEEEATHEESCEEATHEGSCEEATHQPADDSGTSCVTVDKVTVNETSRQEVTLQEDASDRAETSHEAAQEPAKTWVDMVYFFDEIEWDSFFKWYTGSGRHRATRLSGGLASLGLDYLDSLYAFGKDEDRGTARLKASFEANISLETRSFLPEAVGWRVDWHEHLLPRSKRGKLPQTHFEEDFEEDPSEPNGGWFHYAGFKTPKPGVPKAISVAFNYQESFILLREAGYMFWDDVRLLGRMKRLGDNQARADKEEDLLHGTKLGMGFSDCRDPIYIDSFDEDRCKTLEVQFMDLRLPRKHMERYSEIYGFSYY